MLDYGFNFMNTGIYIDNEATICIVKNLVFHSKTKHIEIRHHFIRDSYEKRLIQVFKDGFDGCIGLKMLFGPVLRVKHGKKLVSAARLALCCWAKVSTVRHRVSAGPMANFGKILRRKQPSSDIGLPDILFDQFCSHLVVGEGSEQPPKPQPTPSTAPPEFLSQITTDAASQPPKDPNMYRRTKRRRNTKVPQSGGSPNKVGDEVINEEMLDSSGPWRQETMGGIQAQTRSEGVSNLSSDPPLSGGHTLGSGKDSIEHQIKLTDNVPKHKPHDSPFILGVNTPRSDEGSLELNELMDLVTKLSHRVFDLEKVKTAHAKELLGRKHLKTQLQFGEDAFDDIDDLVDEGIAFVQEKDAENQGKIISTASVPKTVSTVAPRTPPTTTVFDDEDARMDADYELAARMTQEEQEKYTIEERGLYERQQKRIQDFTPMDSEKEAQKPGKRLKRVAGSYATQKSPKKPKVMKSAKDVTEEEAAEYEKEKEELRLSLKIISNDDSEVDYEPLSRKIPIVNWEYRLLEKMEAKDMYVYKLTRVGGSLSYHGDTQAFLRRLDRQDLNNLYSCGVYTLFMDGTPMEINMLVEKKYPLIKELLEKMLNLQLEAKEESTMAFELIKFIKSLLEE
ncbi:hypothetical protein Tco_0299271 [Tanacetum coccineum]